MSSSRLTATEERMPLNKNQIVEEALSLVDEQGLDAFGMRALARRLAVRPAALYWHFANRDELVVAMAGAFYRRAMEAAPTGRDWRRWVVAYGHAFRNALLAHRDSARLCAMARPLAQMDDATLDIAAPLVAEGLDRRYALTCLAMTISLTVGWTVYEQSESMHDYLEEAVGFEDGYRKGLNALVQGFALQEEGHAIARADHDRR